MNNDVIDLISKYINLRITVQNKGQDPNDEQSKGFRLGQEYILNEVIKDLRSILDDDVNNQKLLDLENAAKHAEKVHGKSSPEAREAWHRVEYALMLHDAEVVYGNEERYKDDL